jgi:pyruvate formate lyase activating enzyme
MVGDLKCQVIEITRGTTHDGPGMRTTVFMKGCPLNCQWCQNPEGIQSGQEVWWEERKCIRCLECIEICPEGAVFEDEEGLQRDRDLCSRCGTCVENCPAKAATFTGREWKLEELLAEVRKDQDFYAAFGGGVTVSGGEPLNQFRFVAEFFKQLHESGIHTALDTCGLASREALRSVLPYTDAVLFDIKILDAVKHKTYTGQSNEIILDNLLYIADHMRKVNHSRMAENDPAMRLWIRTPLIPETTATEENIAAIGAFIRENLPDVVERWELCAFNPACKSKYKKLGRDWVYAETPLMGQSEVDRIKETALAASGMDGKLIVSGLVAKAG